MDKSIMSLADEILGGALSNPTKTNSTMVNPYNEADLPELSDAQRASMLDESLDSAQRDPETIRKKKEWEEKNREKRKLQAKARSIRGSRLEPEETNRQDTHKASRGQKKGSPGFKDTRASGSASPGSSEYNRKELSRWKAPSARAAIKGRHKDAINKSRKERGATELAHLTSDQKLILQQAREIIREMTSVGAIGVGPQMTASRAFSTHGANMGKDTVPVKPVDKSMRKVEKSKASKKKAKKVKKESFELFLDRILNEHLGDK